MKEQIKKKDSLNDGFFSFTKGKVILIILLFGPYFIGMVYFLLSSEEVNLFIAFIGIIYIIMSFLWLYFISCIIIYIYNKLRRRK